MLAEEPHFTPPQWLPVLPSSRVSLRPDTGDPGLAIEPLLGHLKLLHLQGQFFLKYKAEGIKCDNVYGMLSTDPGER